MSRSGLCRLALLILTITGVTAAQQSPQPTTAAPTRDPQAVSILQQAISAAGGAQALLAIQDFNASGTILYPSLLPPLSGTVTIQGKGPDQVRFDATVPQGKRSLVINHSVGVFNDIGSSTKVSFLNGSQFGLLIFALPRVNTPLVDAGADVTLEGTEQILGSTAYKIKVTPSSLKGLERDQSLRKFQSYELLIDSTTSMVVALRHIYYPRETNVYALTREVAFGDYRQVGGVMFPFSITERIGGQTNWQVTLASANFNVGLTDTVFQY